MSKLKTKISNVFKTRRINVLLVFVFLSFAILVLTKLAKEYTKTVEYSINVANLPEDIVIIKDSTNTLKVTLSAFGFDWLGKAFRSKELSVDFENDVVKTDSEFIWSKSRGYSNINSQFDKNFKLLNINPDTLWFKYDINSVKYVPVKLNGSIQYSLGYNSLKPLIIEPDSVKVIGPDSLLKNIHTIETEQVAFENVKQSISQELKFKLDSIDTSIKVVPKTVRVVAEVEKFTEGTLEIPVEIANVPRNIRIKHFPKKVSVSYKTTLLAYKTVLESDFKVVCDYSKISEDASYLTPELIEVPKTIKDARLHQQKIEFILTK